VQALGTYTQQQTNEAIVWI